MTNAISMGSYFPLWAWPIKRFTEQPCNPFMSWTTAYHQLRYAISLWMNSDLENICKSVSGSIPLRNAFHIAQ